MVQVEVVMVTCVPEGLET